MQLVMVFSITLSSIRQFKLNLTLLCLGTEQQQVPVEGNAPATGISAQDLQRAMSMFQNPVQYLHNSHMDDEIDNDIGTSNFSRSSFRA